MTTLPRNWKRPHRLGFTQIEDARPPFESFGNSKALRFPNQGQFHILKYLSGLAKAIEQAGGQLFSGTSAIEWKGEDSPQVTTADGGTIEADSIVLATNYPIMSKMFAQLPAYRTYAIGVRIPKGAVEKMLLWDTGDPYHYVRIQEEDGHDLLIVGGEDHRTGQAGRRGRAIYPAVGMGQEIFSAGRRRAIRMVRAMPGNA